MHIYCHAGEVGVKGACGGVWNAQLATFAKSRLSKPNILSRALQNEVNIVS